MSAPVIPTICCDMVLKGSASCLADVTEALQWESMADEGDWKLSTGEVRCTSSDQVTAVLMQFFPEYARKSFLDVKRAHALTSMITLRIHCNTSYFPFTILDESLIHFLWSTDTELILSVIDTELILSVTDTELILPATESNEISDDPAVRLRLNLVGKDLAFDQIETITGQTPWSKKRKQDFPAQATNCVEDMWVYRTEPFCIRDLKERAHTFSHAFSHRGLPALIQPAKSSIELNIYSADGLRFEQTIPRELLSLAQQLSVKIAVGRYA